MVFNKLPKEMRRTLALTLAASMVATGTQTPVLADQVQEVSAQEVQNTQTEAGEKQNVQAAEQQEEVPGAEQQAGTVGQAEAEESVDENLDDTVSANTMASINNKTSDTEDLDAEEVIDEEINIDMAAEADNATYVEIAVTSGDEENGKLSCGFEFNKATMTARLVKIVPAKEAVNRPKFAEDADEKDKRVTLKLDQVTDDDGNVYTVTSIYNDAGICGSNIPMIDLVIGANVATIGKNAFRNNPVRSLTFEAGSGLSEIGDYAFSTSYLEDDIVIPQKVKSIGEGAFQGTACTNVRFVANTVTTSVGKSAFANCKKLETVLFDDSYAMTEMGESIFEGCTKLQTVSGFPAGVTKVPDSCFSGDSELTKVEYANIAAVTEIGKSAFMKCQKLEADEAYNPIGENVISIGASAFAGCGSTYKIAAEDYTCFTEITIPAGVTKLEASTFANCTTLEKVTFADENRVVEIGDSCFEGDTALTICELPAQLEKLGNASFSKTALTSVRIPATLKIANSPFAECQKIKSIQWGTETAKVTKVVDTLFQNLKSAIEVDFADQITEIGASAFASSSITGVNGTGKVETVNEKGFMNCNTLVGEVNMPALTQIYAYAFSGVGATDFIISNDVMVIDEGAFAKCSNLKSMNIAAGVADVDLGNMTKLGQIGKNAFSGCQAIVSLQLPGTVTKIEEGAFSGLTALANVKFKDNGEKGTTTIGTSAFSGCTNLVDVETASNVGVIDNNAFSDCVKLMRLKLADGLQTIGNSAFAGCKRLEGALPDGTEEEYEIVEEKRVKLPNPNAQLVIPESVTTIGDSAFANCYNDDETHTPEGGSEKVYKIGIKSVTIAGNPAGTTIGASAFAGCQNLTKLTLGEGVTGLGDSALKDTRLEEITIPATFETGTAKNSPFTSRENSTLKKVTFADGIQVIPQYFLNNITTLTEIEIPASVQKIGDHAFAGCSSLKTVTFKDEAASKLTTIDTSAFEDCSLMTLFKLPEGVITINASAFKNCENVEFAELPEGLITIGKSAFENCEGIQISKMPAITTLDDKAFAGCVCIQGLELDTSNLVTINATAFEGCTSLTSVQIDGGEKKQTTIADGAFATCENLNWVIINNIKSVGKKAFTNLPISILEINQVDAIGESAFAGCDKLENPVIQNTKTIGASAFAGAGYVKETGAEETDNEVRLYNIQNVGSRAFENSKFTAADICDLNAVTTYKDQETKVEYSPFAKSSIKSVRFNGAANNTVCANAFKNVTSLQSVKLAYCLAYDNISTIDTSAFEGCVNLTDINLSDELTTINGLAFYNTGLTEITVPASLTKITAASAAGKTVSPFAGGVLRKVTFADGVTKSLQGMFMGTTSLEEVVLPESLKTIDQNTFKDCSGLKKLSVVKSDQETGEYVAAEENVLDTVETINAGAFNGCSSLETLTLKNVAKIDSNETNRTFGGCTSLKNISVTGVTTTDNTGKAAPGTIIGVSAFKDNKALKDIKLDTIKTISQDAFRGCGVAQDDTTDPAKLTLNNVTGIGALAFYGCGFKEVQIPRQLSSVTIGRIDGVDYGPFAGGKLENISFEKFMTTMPDNLCLNTQSLKTINLQAVKTTLRTIGKNAFKGCIGVETVTIPKIVTTVSESAFEDCSGLTDVTVAAQAINAKAFAGCTNLKTVKLEEGVTTIQGMVFANTQIDTITIPSTLTTAGITKDGTVEKGPFAGTMIATVHGADDSDGIENGATILPETKKIPDNLFLGCNSIIDVQIPSTVTDIGQKAFKDAVNVETVTFHVNTESGTPAGIQTIGISAFDGCNSLKEITLPETVTDVMQGAFANEKSVTRVDMSKAKSLKKWDKETFKNDTALQEIALPAVSSITAIPDGAFAGCTSLTGENLEIPKNIVTITANAFKESGLRKLYIPNQITAIGASAFESCKDLENVHISNNITIINQNTFKNCEKLLKVEIPVKVAEIGTNAFYGSGLRDVYIFGDPKIGGGITNTYAGMKNQLSVFENQLIDETATLSHHVFNTGFTIHGGKGTKLKTAFFGTYCTKTDGPTVLSAADSKGTLAVYSTSTGNEDLPCMSWDSLDEDIYSAKTVKLNQTELVMMAKNKKTLVATVVPVDETKEDAVMNALTWESSDTKVATVDKNGVVSAVAEGTAVITAKAGNAKAECSIEVRSPITSIIMTEDGGKDSLTSLIMEGGDSKYVTFTVTKDNKQTSDQYMVTAVDPSVVSIEKVDKNSDIYVIKALKKGKTDIVCNATDDSGFSKTFAVTVGSTQHIVRDLSEFTNNNADDTGTYEANTQDSWTYHVDGVSEIRITFNDLTEVEPGKDYLLIYDKDGNTNLYDGDSKTNGVATVEEDGTVKYTDKQLANKTVTVKGDTVRIRIVSDESGERYGFKVNNVVTKNTITYVLNGGLTRNNPNPYSYSSDATEPIILKAATREDAIFVGWYTDKACTIPITEIKPGIGGVTVYAKWQENPAVIYKLNGAPDSVNKQNPKYVPFDNEEEIVLQAIEREGYTFLGWYTDKECTKQITAIPAHTKVALTIYAKWEKKTAPAEPTPTPTPTPVPTPEPSKVPTPQPSKTPAPEPSKTPSQEPAKTPENKPAKAGTQLSAAEAGASYQVVSEDEKQPTVVYTAPADKNVKKITVPATITVGGITYKVESVAPDAFKNCRKLTSVKISAGVQKIGKNAFSGCSKLSSVTIGKDVTEIGAGAFANCKALKKITIPAAVTKIGKKAFNKCKKLKTVTIKTKKLKTVGSSAFKGIAKKAVIKLPKAKKAAYKKLLKKKYDKTTKLK